MSNQLSRDWESFWNDRPTGFAESVAGGTLMKTGNDTAVFKSANGQSYQLDSKTSIYKIAEMIPEIGQAWKSGYGETAFNQAVQEQQIGSTTLYGGPSNVTDIYDPNTFNQTSDWYSLNTGQPYGSQYQTPTPNQNPTPTPNQDQNIGYNTAGDVLATGDDVNTTGFDLLNPTAFPWSVTGSQYTNQSQDVSGQYSGLGNDTVQQLLGMVMPELGKSLTGFANLPQDYTQNALGMYKTLMQQGLDKVLPQTLQGVMNRGIVGGDVMSDALAGTASQVIPSLSTMGYQAGLDAANLGLEVPGVLGQLLGLAQYTQGASAGTSTGGSNSFSYNEDRSVPQGQLYDFLSGLNLNFV